MRETSIALTLCGLSFLMTVIWGGPLIHILRHFRIGKLIRFEGPNSHITKLGTPTMGGWMIIVPVVLITILMNAAIIIGLKIFSTIVFVPLAVLLGYGCLGAIDDWEGIRGERIGKGMSARTKLFIQIVFAIPVAYLLRDVIHVPQMFWPGVYDAFELRGLYIPIAVFIIIASSNAVNFTDGLDGLAGLISATAFAAFGGIALLQGQDFIGRFCFTMVGAMFGFLWFNVHPAELFMGDTGSLSIGATMGVIALMTGQWLLLPVIAIIPVSEGISVVLQIFYFRITKGKRLFKMAPLHHHFELLGWSETQVVQRFWLVSLVFAMAGIALHWCKYERLVERENVLIIGAARQGLALTRYLCSIGCRVTLNDNRTSDKLVKAIDSISELPVKLILGGHPLDSLTGITLVCISGGVSPELPLVLEARKQNIPISNDTQIFMEMVLCPTIGITGSAGKTTTTTLVGRIAQAGAKPGQKIWIGGNIGTPLITFIDEIKESDLVVLELSSFQLELMSSSPKISAVLNITPNHLDRHGTMDAYKTAKRRIFDFQNSGDHAILCRDDAGSNELIPFVKSNLTTFGWNRPMDRVPGTFLQENALVYFDGKNDHLLLNQEDIALRGDHNLLNVLAACAISIAAGFDILGMQPGIKGFGGVDHRLEFVGDVNGSAWYNDSIATAPERTMAAIRSFTEPLVLLIGGRDKKLPWEDLVELIKNRVDHVVVFGESAPKILTLLENIKTETPLLTIDHAAGLGQAVQMAYRRSEPDDVVLLSPGGTSYDEFEDFEERGECFRTLVKNLQ